MSPPGSFSGMTGQIQKACQDLLVLGAELGISLLALAVFLLDSLYVLVLASRAAPHLYLSVTAANCYAALAEGWHDVRVP